MAVAIGDIDDDDDFDEVHDINVTPFIDVMLVLLIGELMDILERLRVGGYQKIALVALEGVSTDAAVPSAGKP
jgi:biopolymer transport protein ExbD